MRLPIRVTITLFEDDGYHRYYLMSVAAPYSDDTLIGCLMESDDRSNRVVHVHEDALGLDDAVLHRVLLALFPRVRSEMAFRGGTRIEWWHSNVSAVINGMVYGDDLRQFGAALGHHLKPESYIMSFAIISK